MKSFYPSSTDLELNLPLTFLIQSKDQSDLETFKSYFGQNLNQKWILKPGEYTNRGRGIKISEKLATIEKYVASSKRSWCIIQKYISNPLLVNSGTGGNRKFDIRCFGLYTCFGGKEKGYFFQDGYLRTASKEFKHSDVGDKFIHLTNDAIQK